MRTYGSFVKNNFALNFMPDAWRWPLLVWIVNMIFLAGWLLLLQNFGIIHAVPSAIDQSGWLQPWMRSDTIVYIDIARYGYTTPTTSLYYPLYPFLVRWLHKLTSLPELNSMLILSNLFTLGSLLVLYRLANSYGGKETAQRTMIVAAIFPTSFYYWSGYPQSLLLLLLLSAHLFARSRRWWAVCLVGLAAGCTHSNALVAILPLMVLGFQSLRASKHWLRWTLLLPAGFPLLGIVLFLAWRINAGFDSYALTTYIDFQRVIRWPWQTLFQAIYEAFSPGVIQMMPRVNLVILLLLVIALIWSIRQLPMEYSSYLLVGLLLGLTFSCQIEALWSFSRYVLSIFPLFFVIAEWMKLRNARMWLFGFMVASWLFLSAIYLSGAWVA